MANVQARVFVSSVDPLLSEPPVEMYVNRRKHFVEREERVITGRCDVLDSTIRGACDIDPAAVAWPPGAWGMDADRVTRFSVTDVVFSYGDLVTAYWEAVIA